MGIIKENPLRPVELPNFCNLGVWLRCLLLVQAVLLVVAALEVRTLVAFWPAVTDMAVFVEPVLLLTLCSLCPARPLLLRLNYSRGLFSVGVLVLAYTALVHAVLDHLTGYSLLPSLERALLFALLFFGGLAAYFHLRARALSPAIDEARLQALQARIRPHFLFNSLNAVLSLIRSDPHRAEKALEDLADLFRVLMGSNLHLVPLEQEITLARQYLELEQLRLGERLRVSWHTEKLPARIFVPPLMLQPLLENAVYHGIEPAAVPGDILVNIYVRRAQLHLVISNPYHREGGHHSGNKMAIGNIRERLRLHFDAEARLEARLKGDAYQVHVIMPQVTEAQ